MKAPDTSLVTSSQVTVLRKPDTRALVKIDGDGKVWCKPRAQQWFRMDTGTACRYGSPLTLRPADRASYIATLMGRGFVLEAKR